MKELTEKGTYQVSEEVKQKLQNVFKGYCCDDKKTEEVVGKIYQKYQYLIDPHTAVAFSALEQYRAETGDASPCVVVSTASPFKFCDSVLQALGEEKFADGLDVLDQLSDLTGIAAPTPLAGLRNKKVRFTRTVEKEDMVQAVFAMLE